jgi:hypothetical protein
MKQRLCVDNSLGIYPAQDGFVTYEFQEDKILVHVRCPCDGDSGNYLTSAEEMLTKALSDAPKAVAFAEIKSRELMPDFWSIHDQSCRTGSRLAVWLIDLNPSDGTSSFMISRNHDFDFDTPFFSGLDFLKESPLFLPDVPENHFVRMSRSIDGEILGFRPVS